MGDTLAHWAKQTAIDLVSSPQEVRRRTEQPVEFGGYKFSAPKPFFQAVIPRKAGLFVVQVQRGWWTKHLYRPIHVGECENLYEALLVNGESDVVRWLMHPRTVSGLFISVLPTPLMDQSLREQLQTRLIGQYLQDVDAFLQGFRRMRSASELAAG